MIKEKLRDVLAVFAIIFALILSVVLFSVRSEGGYAYNNEYFGREDIYDNWNEAKTHRINLNDCENSLTIEDGGYYELSGDLKGQLAISGSSKSVYFIRLAGVNISNENGPCILVNNAGKVILELMSGSENTIYMGEGSLDESFDGAIYSKDDLTVRGSGSLNVTGDYSHGIVCNDKLVFAGGNINITAKEDGVHANELIALREIVMNITAGDDGITVKNDDGTGVFFGESGKVLINDCYEGIEGDSVIIADGTYEIYPTDDGINAMNSVEIRSGNIRIENTKGRDCDGIDSNGDIIISGGEIYISLPAGNMNEPLDGGIESGGAVTITGGNIEAYVGGEEVDAIEMAGQSFAGGFGGGKPSGFGGEMPREFDGEMPREFGGEMPEGFAGGKPGDIVEGKPDVFGDEFSRGKGIPGGDLSENQREQLNEKIGEFPQIMERGDHNEVTNQNNATEIFKFIGVSAIILCVAFILVIFKKSRVNI